MKIIYFAGTEKYDILINSAAAMAEAGKKVLLADISGEYDLLYCLKDMGHEGKIISFSGFDFIWGTNIDEKIYSTYDVVLIECGFIMPETFIEKESRFVIVTDLKKSSLEVNRYNTGYMEKYTLIIRDTCMAPLDERLVIKNPCFNRKKIEKVFVLRHNAMDYAATVSMQYGYRSMNNIYSYTYRMFIKELIMYIGNVDYESAYYAVERGAVSV